jgi:hypothetical protein
MRKVSAIAILALMVGVAGEGCFAGVAKVSFKASKFLVRESAHAGKFSAKHAAHYSVKAGKVAKKVLY